jgi:hypothetical protein
VQKALGALGHRADTRRARFGEEAAVGADALVVVDVEEPAPTLTREEFLAQTAVLDE